MDYTVTVRYKLNHIVKRIWDYSNEDEFLTYDRSNWEDIARNELELSFSNADYQESVFYERHLDEMVDEIVGQIIDRIEEWMGRLDTQKEKWEA